MFTRFSSRRALFLVFASTLCLIGTTTVARAQYGVVHTPVAATGGVYTSFPEFVMNASGKVAFLATVTDGTLRIMTTPSAPFVRYPVIDTIGTGFAAPSLLGNIRIEDSGYVVYKRVFQSSTTIRRGIGDGNAPATLVSAGMVLSPGYVSDYATLNSFDGFVMNGAGGLGLDAIVTPYNSSLTYPAVVGGGTAYPYVAVLPGNNGAFTHRVAGRNAGQIVYRYSASGANPVQAIMGELGAGGGNKLFTSTNSSTAVRIVTAALPQGAYTSVQFAALPAKFDTEGSGSSYVNHVAYVGDSGGGASGVYAYRNGETSLIARNAGFLSWFEAPRINAAGSVTFLAGRDAGGSGIYRENPLNADAPMSLATSDGEFATFDALGINDAGTVVFAATKDNGAKGLYVRKGAAPLLTVIETGAAWNNSTVTGFAFDHKTGFNGGDQILFGYTLANGEKGIARAAIVAQRGQVIPRKQ